MQVRDIMTTGVVFVTPETPVHEAALMLAERRISGMPVLSGGRLAGIVSESDFLRRHELGTGEDAVPAPWWKQILHAERAPVDYVRSHAVRVGDVMTRRVVTVRDDAPAATAAGLMERRKLRRLPVLRGEALAGIVTRADIVRALARRAREQRGRPPLGDTQIRWVLLTELSGQPWWNTSCAVQVQRGTVHYWGLCDDEWQKDAARVAAENIPGVQGVVDHRLTLRQLPYFMG